MNIKTVSDYSAGREDMLSQIELALTTDPRIVALWLVGSYAHGEQDAFSDLDICVVFALEHIRLIQNWSEFISEFGEPVNVHEAPQNAPPGGTMLSTLYGNGVTIDWMLIPLESARVPLDARLLFERQPLPRQVAQVTGVEDKENQLKDRLTFFWMMAAVAAKSILRQDAFGFHFFLSVLNQASEEIADLTTGKLHRYSKNTGLKLQISQAEQKETLIALCAKVADITKVTAAGPLTAIKQLLEMPT